MSVLHFLCLVELRRKEAKKTRSWRSNLRMRNQMEVIADNRDFQKLYRFTPELFEELCRELVPLLPPCKRSDGISPTTKVLTTLAFYASGSYQRAVGRSIDSIMAQQTVSDAVRQVTAALNDKDLLFKYIRFPQNLQEREEIKQGFFEKFGMPGCIGCVDGTHVALIRPRVYEERYFNRKYYHSRNVQVICDANLRIISVDASFGGASHDCYVFQRSQVKRHLEDLEGNTWLLGDAGYPQRAYLMTPIVNAVDGTPEATYNKVQKTTRNTIERTFGVLKGRWRCLLAARELHYDPLMVAKIIYACCVLHNYCNARNELIAPRLSRRDRRIERYLQEHPSATAVARRTNAAELRAGQEARAHLVQALSQI